MSLHSRSLVASSLLASLTMVSVQSMAQAQVEKPNIVLIVSDDFGYGDMGVYGGGENRGMPTPNFDRMANEGHAILLLLRPAELHARARGDA